MTNSPNFNLLTWNATGIMTGSSYVSDCLNEHAIDFCGFSVNWLYENDHHFLGKLNNAYSYYAVSDKDISIVGNRKVGKDGVAILWKDKYDNIVSRLPVCNNRILGMQVELSNSHFIYILKKASLL